MIARAPWMLLAVAACAAGCQRNAPSGKLVVGVSALRISLPVFVAAEQGLFRRHGLEVELKSYATAQPLIDDVAAGRLDAGGFAAYPIVLLGARGAARAPRIATSLLEDRDHRLSWVLARKGAGLRFPADARGKRIGILPTVAYQRWLAAILRTAGIGPTEVTVVPVAPPLQAQTLAAGGIDLLFSNDPMATAILAAGAAEIADDGPPCATRLGDPFAFGTFLLAGALAEERADAASRLVAAIDDGIASLRADPAAARRAMAAHVRVEERPWIDRYPDARYETSREVVAGALAEEAARERALGILESDHEPAVRAWSPGAR